MKFGIAIASIITTSAVAGISANQEGFLRRGGLEDIHRLLAPAGTAPAGYVDCMQTRYTDAGNRGTLGCTANDVAVTNVIVKEGPEACTAGEMVTITADFELVLNSNARYDIGLYLLTDFSDPTATAADGASCFLTGFDYESDGTCGDITTSTKTITGVTFDVLCSSANGGVLSLPYCTSWNQQDDDACNSLDQIGYPLTKSKCNCEEASIPIRLCEVEVTPTVYESCSGGTIDFEASATGVFGDTPVYTWTATDGTSTFTETGSSGSFSGLAAGTYDVTVALVDGPCTDEVSAGSVNVYETVSLSGSLEGSCTGVYDVSASASGGRGGGSFEWTVGGTVVSNSASDTIASSSTGTISAEVTYTESCPSCAPSEGGSCSYLKDSGLSDTVYKPLEITLSGSVTDETCVTNSNPSYTISATVSEGSGSYTLAGHDELSCGASVCTLDLSGVSVDCFSGTYAVTVTDADSRCGSLTSSSFSAGKATTYDVTI